MSLFTVELKISKHHFSQETGPAALFKLGIFQTFSLILPLKTLEILTGSMDPYLAEIRTYSSHPRQYVYTEAGCGALTQSYSTLPGNAAESQWEKQFSEGQQGNWCLKQ